MEGIEIQKTKDEVAKGHNYETWGKALNGHRYNFISSKEMNQMTDEVILEVAKQVAEGQRYICAKIARALLGLTYNNGQPPKHTAHIDTESILNSPSPEIK